MLQIKFPKERPISKRNPEIIYTNTPEPSAWAKQKPRMSSARIMMEVRRRLWQEACSENTGWYQTDKLIERIKAIDKRIAKRLENNAVQSSGAYQGDQGPTMGMSY